MIAGIELGLIYAVMALGVYLTFRVLDFPDLTVDQSFTTGAATSAMVILNGGSPWIATVVGFVAGGLAGLITALLHTKAKINGLLAGILTMTALYSINLRLMGGKANLALLREDTVFTPLREAGLQGTVTGVLLLLVGVLVVKVVLDWFLYTDAGLAMQATGDNPDMIRSFGVNTDAQKILGLCLSNALVGLAGALIAQYQGFADIGMGIGMIVVGLASVILGQGIFGHRTVVVATFAVVLGSVLYRLVITVALQAGLNPSDMKLISAVLVVVALVLPQMAVFKRWKRRRTLKAAQEVQADVGSSTEHPVTASIATTSAGKGA
ncbi:ABC transporter permease [Kocuria rhizophila]|uniref:ABC transporter permease n=1 Tax=Kocuria TaxID=57493 RepID=UPI000308A2A3|nr:MULTISPECIES: ABC transporter permease [Kocuria]MXN62143.1 ABC transporter permease [Bacillus sp. BGMRC0062]KMK73707.1 ABC transporter permease [Kocuria rhizophila]MBO4145186.1 ABC transporter permease [Kocuria rhizophila]MCG7423586.1 ABC transporter permease [Kocuria rhizophila]MCT1456172.1 ABC transporter permease [Kocuria rhizophila]